MRAADPDEAFDYVIVGAGSAGCVLANRLSEDGRATVLVLEAGGSDRNFWIAMPIGYGRTYYDARVNWKYSTEPVAALGGRQSYWPRGKVLGGSSAINAMVYVRGHPGDFDAWGREAPGWSWADVSPVFRRMERWARGADEWRGGSGPLFVSDISDQIHPLCEYYLEAARQSGLGVNPDYNGAAMEGAAVYQLTTHGGRRASAARCYLRPALTRANVSLRTAAHASRIDFVGRRAVGVTYAQGGRERRVRARREVIVSAGAVNSALLLQLSGIGPGDVLTRCGIAVRHENRHVGRNLQDHLGIDLIYHARVPTLNQVLGSWVGRMMAGANFLARRRGPLSLSVNQCGGFARTRPELTVPDVQLYFSPLSYTRAPVGTRPLMRPDPFPGFLFGLSPCRPESRGHLEIRSADPAAPPLIHPNYLATDSDRADMLAGLRLVRRIAAMPALSEVIEAELSPGAEAASDEELADHVRDQAWTVFHPCGTCRMGQDPGGSVVDPSLRVHGIERLRVIDASVFPNIPSGNINAPTIMVAERAAELIRQAG
ncbi:MAG TPA: GMC family oxidoreductase N-terminal domain-containing protein [Paracoccaceae bacterium]|nr:GMC family oxidoreductase N-terminal domain-containing protein [Paracoccaceae bacterium]